MSVSNINKKALFDNVCFLIQNSLTVCDGWEVASLVLRVQAAEVAFQTLLSLLGEETDRSWGARANEKGLPSTKEIVGKADEKLHVEIPTITFEDKPLSLRKLLYGKFLGELTWVKCRNYVIHVDLDTLFGRSPEDVAKVDGHINKVMVCTFTILANLLLIRGEIDGEFADLWGRRITDAAVAHAKRHGLLEDEEAFAREVKFFGR